MSPERRRNHEDPLSIYEATCHINQLAFPIQMADAAICCIDGRTPDDVSEVAPCRVPGGPLGVLGSVLHACQGQEIPIQDHENVFLEAMRECMPPSKMRLHTDEHDTALHCRPSMSGTIYRNPSTRCAGCGHANGLYHNSDYGLTPKAKAILLHAEQVWLESDAKLDTLPGDHNERAVVIVQSPNIGLKNILPDGRGQIFVVHDAGVRHSLQQVAERLHENGLFHAENGSLMQPSDIFAQLYKSHQLHLGLTAAKLAKGLPTFYVQGSYGSLCVTQNAASEGSYTQRL